LSLQNDRRGPRPFHRANARSPFPAFAGQDEGSAATATTSNAGADAAVRHRFVLI
jgi:hypothetical protein